MRKIICVLSLVIFAFAGCENIATTPVNNENTIASSWKYVGVFSHLADYKCYVCEDFDASKAYSLNLKKDGTLEGNVGALILSGSYTIKKETPPKVSFTTQRMNKPWETKAETTFINNLSEADSYNIGRDGKYNYLLVNITNERFLYFVAE